MTSALGEPQIRFYTNDKKKLSRMLIDAAKHISGTLARAERIHDNKPPAALLYIRCAMRSSRVTKLTSIKLRESLNLFRSLKQWPQHEPPFRSCQSRSARQRKSLPTLSRRNHRFIRPDGGDFITSALGTLAVARYLRQQLRALEVLKNASTARLERAFAEHSIVHIPFGCVGARSCALSTRAHARHSRCAESEPRPRIYLARYAWLEDVRPKQKSTPVRTRSGFGDNF